MAATALAQSSQALIIRVHPAARTPELQVHYFLNGAFGGVGGWQITSTGDGAVSIPTAYEGVPAKSLKAILYLPGCQIKIVSTNYPGTLTADSDFVCHPLGTISLKGAFATSDLVPGQAWYVDVHYMAAWDHKFFGILDGPVTDLPLGTARVASGGSFQIQIPDFSADPITSDFREDAYLQLRLRSEKTGNVVGVLKPPQSLSAWHDGLTIASSYPSPLWFNVQAP